MDQVEYTDFKETGKLLEKYNVVDTTLLAGGGEYPNQDGFGWTNGVLLKLIKQRNETNQTGLPRKDLSPVYPWKLTVQCILALHY